MRDRKRIEVHHPLAVHRAVDDLLEIERFVRHAERPMSCRPRTASLAAQRLDDLELRLTILEPLKACFRSAWPLAMLPQRRRNARAI